MCICVKNKITLMVRCDGRIWFLYINFEIFTNAFKISKEKKQNANQGSKIRRTKIYEQNFKLEMKKI